MGGGVTGPCSKTGLFWPWSTSWPQTCLGGKAAAPARVGRQARNCRGTGPGPERGAHTSHTPTACSLPHRPRGSPQPVSEGLAPGQDLRN